MEAEYNTDIYIDDSSEVLAERISLIKERLSYFTGESVEPGLREFFLTAKEAVIEMTDGGKDVQVKAPAGYQVLSFFADELTLKKGESAKGVCMAGETLLQLLSLYEDTETVPDAKEKEAKDIVYSYLYDYAEELIGGSTGDNFLTELLFSERNDSFINDGVSLFLGDRMKARILSALKSTGRKGTVREGFEGEGLTEHKKNTISDLFKKASVMVMAVLLVISLCACGGKKEKEETTEVETTEAKEEYPETVAYAPSEGEAGDMFGVMHALVLNVQKGEKEGLYVYTLRDESDPENAWALNSQDIGDIVTTVERGNKVAVLFSGDMIEDADNVEFIAILEDKNYKIKYIEGVTVANMMSSFSVRAKDGKEYNFIKDNCRVDRDALSTEGKSKVVVYYADCGATEYYPVRVYKIKDENKN